MTGSGLASDLRRLVGSDAVLIDEADRVAAGRDFVTSRGVPAAVVRAVASEQVAALLGYATEHGIGVVPRGAGTNLAAAMVPAEDSVVLDLAGMHRILKVDAEARRAIVEPGVINGNLKAAVAPAGLVYAPDPASTPISTIGGNIAENAGGPGCIKYGVTFHHVLALDVALADGRVRTLREGDDTDLLGLMIGSEGTLGVITRAEVRLLPVPAARWTALAAFDRVEDAASTVSEIIAAGILPAALEICDRRAVEVLEAHLPSGYPTNKAGILIVELDGQPADVAQDTPALEAILRRSDRSLRTAANEDERTALWAGRLAAGFAFRATGRAFYICDATVPRQRFPEMIRRGGEIASSHGLDVATVGHAGDGNLHPIVFYEPDQLSLVAAAADEIADAALELGGTLSGEHGIGTAKVAQMPRVFGPVELAAFRAIKRSFDAAGILNPGSLLPPATADEPDVGDFGEAVAAAVGSRAQASLPPVKARHEREITVDAENLTVTAGGGATCRAVAAEARKAGLRCTVMETEGTVADVIETDGHRQPARAALLGLETTLPSGQRAKFGSGAMKDVAGLDAKRLVAGGGGVFGRVDRAVLKAIPHRG